MNARDIDAMMAAIAPVVREYVDAAVAPLRDRLESLHNELRRLDTLEERLSQMPAPTVVDTAAIAAQVRSEVDPLIKGVADSVSALIIPEVSEIAGMIAEAVAAIPPPQSVDTAAITSDIREAVQSDLLSIRSIAQEAPSEVIIKDWIAQALIDLPAPKPGEPGKSVTVEECQPVIDVAVAKAVAALPAPKDGDPGTSVTIEDVRPLIAEATRAELANWERPKDGDPGKSVTLDDVTPIIDEAVAKAVAEIPKPKDGEPGKLPIVKAWADEVHYAGEVRAHAGSTWQAVRDTAKEPPHDDWICIARGGADGRTFEVCGTWRAEESYHALDVVALNGAAFVARMDAPGACPGDGWQMIAMQGKQGKPGPAMKGDPGPAGKPVVGISVDDQGMLILTNGDGSTVECDLYPLLSKLGR